MISRHRLSTTSLVVALCLSLGACLPESPTGVENDGYVHLRLNPLPSLTSFPDSPTGLVPLGLTPVGQRDGMIYVPATYRPTRPMPLVLVMHGNPSSGANMVAVHREFADSVGAILLGIDARSTTWMALFGSPGPDNVFINSALFSVFQRYNIDQTNVSVTGFSDGASFALALGRANGDIFRRVAIHAAGLMIPVHAVGSPEFYVTHGTRDQQFPPETSSRLIVPAMRSIGLSVEYVEWEGAHLLSWELLNYAMRWMTEVTPASPAGASPP